MRKLPKFHVKKRVLLAIAGCVWLAAGGNVARLGILSYQMVDAITWRQVLLSLLVFFLFGSMFFSMSKKHTARIHAYPEETKPFWFFFDRKAYCIMI